MLWFLTLLAPIALLNRTATVEAVVQELAEKSGRPLGIRRALRDEVVYVGLGPHEADSLMNLIAQATGAEWVEGEGRTWLDRSNTFRRHQAALEAATFERDCAARLSTLLAESDPSPWKEEGNHASTLARAADGFPASSNGRENGRLKGWRPFARPVGRLLARILRVLPPSSLATISVDESVRFAYRPRAQQRALAGAGPASLRQYAKEQRTFLDELGGMSAEGRQAIEAKLQMFRLPLDPGSGEDLYTVFNATRRADDFALSIHLYDRRARRVDQEVVIVDARPIVKSNSKGVWRNERLKLGPVASSFYEGMRGGKVDLTAATLARNPVSNDPLAILVGDAVEAIARSRGGEEILAIPDEATALAPAIQGNADLGTLSDRLDESVAFEAVGGIRVGHPRRPFSSEANKLDRTALASLFALLKGGRYPGLESLSEYAARQNANVAANRLEWNAIAGAGYYRARAELGVLQSVIYGARDLLRAYGALPPGARTSLRRGFPLPFSSLPLAARADLVRFAFRRESPGTIDGTLDDASSFFDDLPPNGALVSSGGSPGPFVVAEPVGEESAFIPMATLAVAQRRKEMGKLPAKGVEPSSGKFVPGWRPWLGVELKFSPTFRMRGSLSDLYFDPAARPIPFAQLPPDHRAEFDRALATLRR